MKRSLLIFLAMACCLAVAPRSACAASDEANIYFNAGTEKYLQGNFTESIENLEKAQALDPGNKKIKEFMVKILLEAGTQNHLTRNYRQAYIYLEKANRLDPENPKVQEMFKLTQDLLNRTPEKVAQKETVNTQALKNPEKKRDESAIAELAAAARQRKASQARQDQEKAAPAPAVPVIKDQHVGKGPVIFDIGKLKEWDIWMFIGLLMSSALAAVVLFVMWFFRSRTSGNYRKRLAAAEEELKSAAENANSLKIELEKTKEREKFEHQMVEDLQIEIKELNKKAEERLNKTIEMKTKEAEEKVRREITGEDGQKEHFITHQQERFLKYISSTSTPAEAESDPVLASARERIALMAQNLYEYAPGAAVDFITKMAKNENPSIRTNIVQALANIARPETFELLFELYDDKDPRVKREVLRNLKALNQKISSGALSPDDPVADKIRELISSEKDRGEWIF